MVVGSARASGMNRASAPLMTVADLSTAWMSSDVSEPSIVLTSVFAYALRILSLPPCQCVRLARAGRADPQNGMRLSRKTRSMSQNNPSSRMGIEPTRTSTR
jgi:hypothetical protein